MSEIPSKSLLQLATATTQEDRIAIVQGMSGEEKSIAARNLSNLLSLLQVLASPSTLDLSIPQAQTSTDHPIATPSSSRNTIVKRSTKETDISVSVDLDGTGKSSISTGLGFLDHMFTALAKHSMIDITLNCQGDLEVDDHHTAEDCALALGTAFDQALGSAKTGIQRYGTAYAPLDEALARAVVDISGRPFSAVDLKFKREKVGTISTEMLTHVFQSFATAAKITLHITVIEGSNDHHKSEAAFKALALALRQAISIDPRRANDVPSTKGSL